MIFHSCAFSNIYHNFRINKIPKYPCNFTFFFQKTGKKYVENALVRIKKSLVDMVLPYCVSI